MNVPHFSESEFPLGNCPNLQGPNPTPSAAYLSADVYSQALDALVITCVDLVLFHDASVLLGKRVDYPRRGWWVIGGRMIAGETPIQATQRKAKEEVGLTLEGDRFQFSGVYSTQFARRSSRFLPGPLHSVNLTYAATLTPAEATHAQLTSSEYEDQQWITFEAIAPQLHPDSPMDQALLHVLKDAHRLHAN